jgi:hypothetical protein
MLKKQSTEESAETPAKSKTFAWEAVMAEVLRSAPDNKMHQRKFTRAVLAKFKSWLPENEREKKLKFAWFQFAKKLKKADLFEVQNKMVKLVAAKNVSSVPQATKNEARKEEKAELKNLKVESK